MQLLLSKRYLLWDRACPLLSCLSRRSAHLGNALHLHGVGGLVVVRQRKRSSAPRCHAAAVPRVGHPQLFASHQRHHLDTQSKTLGICFGTTHHVPEP